MDVKSSQQSNGLKKSYNKDENELTINNQKKKEFKDKIEQFESNKKQTWTDVIHIDNVNIKCVKISYQFCRI